MGKLIVLEGLDGSGKATQTAMLFKRFNETGANVQKISFPDYNNKSSALVQMYLNGEIGTLDDVNPFAASSFYSLDRYISFHNIWSEFYNSKDAIVISDRYTTSNICHQMSKFPKNRWQKYIEWLHNFEYNQLEIPNPDIVIYLNVHPETSAKLISGRYNGDENKKDIHERNMEYMMRCHEAAKYACAELGWHVIDCCTQDSGLLPAETISALVWEVIENNLQ